MMIKTKLTVSNFEYVNVMGDVYYIRFVFNGKTGGAIFEKEDSLFSACVYFSNEEDNYLIEEATKEAFDYLLIRYKKKAMGEKWELKK